MRLEALAPELATPANGQIDICGLTADSRDVMPGYLFAALAGTHEDGASFIDQAIARGAHAVLADTTRSAAADLSAASNVAVLQSANPRRDLALMAGRFFETQPAHIAAVTGTNGKTSTALFLQQLLNACGHASASLGTLGVHSDTYHAPLVHTTPDPVTLGAALRDLSAHGISHVALEASSHGLAQYRLDGVHVSVAGFTNLSRDHLDYHGDEAAYFAAKQRLFTDVLDTAGIAVIPVNHAAGAHMAEAVEQTGRQVISVGDDAAMLHVRLLARQRDGLMVCARYGTDETEILLPLVGDFQLENLQVALGMALALQANSQDERDLWATLCQAATTLRAPDGRLQRAATTPNGAAIYVDYAHTPDALANALRALRAHMTPEGRLHLVFGCGGDRDAGKRPLMGEIAANLADGVVVTDDNPRHEDAASIRAAILAACPEAQEIAARGEAIAYALTQAEADDFVLVAGKGHETGQIIGDTILPFSDVMQVTQLVENMSGRSMKGGRA